MTAVTDIPQAAAASPHAPADAYRAAYIGGLRDLAGKLEAHPEIPLPSAGRLDPVTLHFLAGDDPRAMMAAAARALGGSWAKNTRDYTGTGGGAYFDLDTTLRGLKIRLTAYRADVCERVVTGTRQITETVPDPVLLDAVPLIEVTRTVEDARWVCIPVMASADAEAAA